MTKYNVHDVISREYNLDELECLYCGSGEVSYNQYIGDALCEECGRWQLDGPYKEVKENIREGILCGNEGTENGP